jgi:sortase (surface protein transpeptidase)
VEFLGVTETNNLDVPKNAGNVGWYMNGPKPSEPGNSVIAGHYDTPTGRPAVFYYLDKLEAGDEIEVVSQNAARNIFVVVEKATVPYNQFPGEEVFSTRPGSNLNLITCGGIWDTRNKTYSDRLIIYTVLKSSLNEG